MKSVEQVSAESRHRRGGCVLYGLAVIGAIALVALAVAAIALGGVLGGGDRSPRASQPPPAPAASPAPPADLAAGEAWLPDVTFSTARLLSDTLDLREVRVNGSGARAASDGTIRADRLDVDAVMTFDAVERQVGNGLQLAPAGNGLVRATQPMSILGRSVNVTADAVVRPDGDRIVIEPQHVQGAGPLDGLVGRMPGITRPVEGLPAGMRLTEVRVEDQGFRVHATGSNVTIQR